MDFEETGRKIRLVLMSEEAVRRETYKRGSALGLSENEIKKAIIRILEERNQILAQNRKWRRPIKKTNKPKVHR